MPDKKDLLFSVTRDDFDIQTFRCGGNGGQNVNKRESGVRFIHRESGSIGESREERQQGQNKNIAFKRCISTPKFKLWMNKKAQEVMSGETVLDAVEKQMNPKNIKVEVQVHGKWVNEAEVANENEITEGN